MKWKIFAVFTMLMFISTAVIGTTATADRCVNSRPTIPLEANFRCRMRLQTISGRAGACGVYGRERADVKAILATKSQRTRYIAGLVCLDSDRNFVFLARLDADCRARSRSGNAYSGLIRGYMSEVVKTGYHWECTECFEFNLQTCKLVRCGPFTGDWFLYHGWLIIIGNYRGIDFWMRLYVGSWAYPGIECHV
jgi:hypothetical protein